MTFRHVFAHRNLAFRGWSITDPDLATGGISRNLTPAPLVTPFDRTIWVEISKSRTRPGVSAGLGGWGMAQYAWDDAAAARIPATGLFIKRAIASSDVATGVLEVVLENM